MKHLKEQIALLRQKDISISLAEMARQLQCNVSSVKYHLNATIKKNQDTYKRLRYQKLITSLKQRAGGKCEICGYHKCLAALDFHHREPKSKSFAIGHSTVVCKPMELLLKEIEKCCLLCSNCHRELHSGVSNLKQ